MIAGLLPAVALAPFTAAALAPTPGTVYQHNREPFLTVVLGYAAADRRAGRIAETRVASDAGRQYVAARLLLAVGMTLTGP